MKVLIQPIILCGGNGTRLWPLSTSKKPKQMIEITENKTMLQMTIDRISMVEKDYIKNGGNNFLKNLLVVNKEHTFPESLDLEKFDVLREEYSNDTAIAVYKSLLYVSNKHPEKEIIIIVIPSDHYIKNTETFSYDIVEGLKNIGNDNIVLFGIEPTAPETKYGYIIPSTNNISFVEKPDCQTALELIKKRAMWNSGIFAAKLCHVLDKLKYSEHNLNEWILNNKPEKAPSFDVAILQKHKNLYAHYCLNWGWSDVGTWNSFIELSEIKCQLNKDTIIADSHNVHVLNRSSQNLVIIGCNDLMVVTTKDNILIMPTGSHYDNQLKDIVNKMKE